VVGSAIWVGNGTVAIIAIQKAGLSIAQALWSGLSIFVGFVWGAFVFDEPIKDLGMSFLALLLMVRVCGCGGVSGTTTNSCHLCSNRDG
jgi:multidrug transporter EmrE-like cation transporter